MTEAMQHGYLDGLAGEPEDTVRYTCPFDLDDYLSGYTVGSAIATIEATYGVADVEYAA